MKKRAQITMESLLLYGAAILVVLLAIAALTYFGVLDMGKWLPQKCKMESTGIFSCEAFVATDTGTDGTIELELKNREAKTVTISGGSFTATDGGLASDCAMSSGTISVTPGQMGVVTITCDTFNAQKGDRLAGFVQLTHTFDGSSLAMTTTGDLSVAVTE